MITQIWHTDTFRSFGGNGFAVQKEHFENYMRTVQQQQKSTQSKQQPLVKAQQSKQASPRKPSIPEKLAQPSVDAGSNARPLLVAQVPKTSPPISLYRPSSAPTASSNQVVAHHATVATSAPPFAVTPPTSLSAQFSFEPSIAIAAESSLDESEEPHVPIQIAAIPKRAPPGTGKYMRAPIPTVKPKEQRIEVNSKLDVPSNATAGPGFSIASEPRLTPFLGSVSTSLTPNPHASPWEPIRPDHPSQKTLEEVEDELEALQLQKDIDQFRYEDEDDATDEHHWTSEVTVQAIGWDNSSPIATFSTPAPVAHTTTPAFTAPLYSTSPHSSGSVAAPPQWQQGAPGFAPPYASMPTYGVPWVQGGDASGSFPPYTGAVAAYGYPAHAPGWGEVAPMPSTSFGSSYQVPAPLVSPLAAQIDQVRSNISLLSFLITPGICCAQH